MCSCGAMVVPRRPSTAATGTDVAPLPLWKRFWLLFTAIWVAVSLLHALTLVTLGEDVPQDRLVNLLLATVLVPAAIYGIGWAWEAFRRGR